MPGFNIPFSDACHDEFAFDEEVGITGPTHLIETSRSHRYVLNIFSPLGGRDDGILLYLNKCGRPSVEIDEIVIHNGQDEIYRPGKNRWKPIDMTFYEVVLDPPIENSTAQMMFRWWAEKVLDLRNSRVNPPRDLVADATLMSLDGVGNPIWIYDLFRCWPTKITPTDLDHKSSEISETTATLRFDKAYEK